MFFIAFLSFFLMDEIGKSDNILLCQKEPKKKPLMACFLWLCFCRAA